MITIGVMSGTSLDGADAVIASFPEDEGAPMATLGRAYLPMPGKLREELKALALGTTNEIERAGDASVVPCGRTQYRRNRKSHADSARREQCTRPRLRHGTGQYAP